jgi:hypothetical protein
MLEIHVPSPHHQNKTSFQFSLACNFFIFLHVKMGNEHDYLSNPFTFVETSIFFIITRSCTAVQALSFNDICKSSD